MVGNGTSGGGVRLDVRLPIGALFSVLGVLLAAYGAATRGRPGTAPTGVPIDLVWGLVLLAFGALMLALARRGMRGREGGGARLASRQGAGSLLGLMATREFWMRSTRLLPMLALLAGLPSPLAAAQRPPRLDALKRAAAQDVEAPGQLTQQITDPIFTFADLGFPGV